ncbi:MAG: hypothetical protein ACK5D9_14245 [Burkholderiales bacterium]
MIILGRSKGVRNDRIAENNRGLSPITCEVDALVLARFAEAVKPPVRALKPEEV